MINAKKEENNRMGKTRISSRNLEIPREHFMQNGHNKGQKWYGSKKQKILRRGGKNTQKNCTKKIFMIQIIMTV